MHGEQPPLASAGRRRHAPADLRALGFPGRGQPHLSGAEKHHRVPPGINLVACDTNLPLGWYKAAEGDYDALMAELSHVLDANPDAQRCCEDEGVSVLADGEIVMLYTNNAGEKTIRLRNGRTIAHTLPAYTALALDAQTGAVLM